MAVEQGHDENFFKAMSFLREVLREDNRELDGWVEIEIDLETGRREVVGYELSRAQLARLTDLRERTGREFKPAFYNCRLAGYVPVENH